MKIALVHEFLTQLGGAERVLEVLHDLFPNAPVHTIVHDKKKTDNNFVKWNVKTSFLQKLPFGITHYKWFLALMPSAIESFKFEGFDVVFSDASAFAKGIKVPKKIPHICYCHTPTRYLWQMEDEYVASQPYPAWALALARLVLAWQRRWDYKAASRVTRFIANSSEVQNRIKKHYNRDSIVIYPPIRTDFFIPKVNPSRDYFLAAGRLEPYKRFDIIIEACRKLSLPLKIAGTGSLETSLKKQYGGSVEFLGRVTDEELRSLYQNARAFVFPAYEDAGMMMVESLACGTPVIAFGKGGALEFIERGKHGVLFEEQTVESLIGAISEFKTMEFDQKILREQAEKFSVEVFKGQIRNVINEYAPRMHE